MTAIVGLYHDHSQPVDPEYGARMMRALEAYPADRTDSWVSGPIFFGCHTQWITPESCREQLPFYDPQEGLAITADAIVDNRAELFDRLGIDRHLRQRLTDSELIMLAYRRWGTDAPRYLHGDFAFFIWDERHQRLFGARDLLGNRSLYYCYQSGQFAFSTTISPLLALPYLCKRLNEEWLAEYLALPSLVDALNLHATPYKQIRQLPPAHCICMEQGRISIEQYSAICPPAEPLRLRSNAEYEEAFRSVFQQAVDDKVRTVRQVGVLLSGGLDSGTVAAFAVHSLKDRGKRLYAYSCIPPADFSDWTARDRIADETPYIQATVDHIGHIIPHMETFQGSSPYQDIDTWLELLELPYKYVENSFWMRGAFEKAQAQQVGVMLTGTGGNETISWGPSLAYYGKLLRKWRWLRLYRELYLYSRRIGTGRRRILPDILQTAFPMLAKQDEKPDQAGLPSMIHPSFAERMRVDERISDYLSELRISTLDACKARELSLQDLRIPSMLGVSGTKLSLRYSVRERDPTLDPRVIRFCASVPLSQYVQNGYDRALIRRATKHMLPDAVRLNQQKRGIQGADWVHRCLPHWPQIREELGRLCQDSAAAPYLHTARLKQLLDNWSVPPKPEHAAHPDLRLFMRSLVVYRFLRRF
ncbi:asparagine synthetase B [Xylanibacillus composti]|nr:asparagine synthetase B [Xylanibacillus composti]